MQNMLVFVEQVRKLPTIIGSSSPEGVSEAQAGRFYVDQSSAELYFKQYDDVGGDRSSGWVLVTIGGGGLNLTYASKTANYTVTSNDYTIDCTSGTFEVALPTSVGISGKMYNIKNSGTGVITVNPNGSETIDGGSTAVLSTQYECITVQSTGTNWVII
jgi:hypothetical protein